MIRTLPFETILFAFLAAMTLVIALAPWPIPFAVQIALLAVGISLFGLPHGAIDPLIARQKAIWSDIASCIAFLLAYIGLVGVVLVIWGSVPVFALSAFLLLSAWHFGGDWKAVTHPALRVLLGGTILSLPSLSHPDETALLYAMLSGPNAADLVPIQSTGLILLSPVLLIGLALQIRKAPTAMIEIGLLVCLGLIAPPLIFFTVYFCALHSMRHLRMSLTDLSDVPRQEKIIWTAGITTLSIVMGITAVIIIPNVTQASFETSVVQVSFIGLAAVTVPHMVLIDGSSFFARLRPITV